MEICPELRTDRLVLEPLEPFHGALLYEGLSDAGLYDFIPESPPTDAAALSARYSRLSRRRSPNGRDIWLNWAVRAGADGNYVGYVQATIAENHEAAVGFVLFRAAWGAGYGTEAVGRMIEHLDEIVGVRVVRGYVDVRNTRSIALLERLRFERVAVERSATAAGDGLAAEAEYVRRIVPNS